MLRKTHLGPKDNIYVSTSAHEKIWGEGGYDDSDKHQNVFIGGDGDDQIYTVSPLDRVNAGAGNDLVSLEVRLTPQSTPIEGGGGNDKLYVQTYGAASISLDKVFTITVD